MRYLAAILAAVMMISSVAVAAEVKGSRRAAGKTAQVTSVAAKVAPEATADWRLLLVNPWNKLPEDYTPNLVKLSLSINYVRTVFCAGSLGKGKRRNRL